MVTKAITIAAVAGLAAAAPQAVTKPIAPQEATPAGCSENYPNTFQIQIVNATHSKRDETSSSATPLEVTLKDSVLTDARNRIGYIADNNQFQFDGPPQAGAIYTAGFSVCQNGSLALGNSAIFYKCLSGMFYNLYDENTASQCSPVYIEVLPQGTATSGSGSTAAAKQLADGQVTANPVTQIGDGQIQANTRINAPVTQIGDGQIQAPSAVAPAPASSNPVTQIGDGQIQAPTSVAAAATGAPVTQIGDGQIQAPTNATIAPAQSSVVPFTGGASSLTFGVSGLVAGLLAVLAL